MKAPAVLVIALAAGTGWYLFDPSSDLSRISMAMMAAGVISLVMGCLSLAAGIPLRGGMRGGEVVLYGLCILLAGLVLRPDGPAASLLSRLR